MWRNRQGFIESECKKPLDNRRTKSESAVPVRWAMPLIHSKSTPGVPVRRHAVQQTALFPAFSDAQGPKAWTGSDLAPIVTGPGGSISGCPAPDCPPASSAEHGAPRHAESRTRDAAACCGAENSAPLVGIARLAANSPLAETQRNSPERPEYFLLPVRSI